MLRKTETLSRLLLTALVASVIGCQADSPNRTSDQIVGPVAPISISVTLRSNKSFLTAEGEGTATLTATVSRDGSPVANFTPVTISTTLGTLDSDSGGASVELLTLGGKVTATLFPGTVAGTARLTATALGAVGITTVQIRPVGEPPPTASTIIVATDKSSVDETVASTDILVTATVLGSDAAPFKDAPVQLSSPIGQFLSSGASSSDILNTNSNGVVSDRLTVTDSELQAFGNPPDTFDVTGTVFIDGGSTSASISITIERAAAPPLVAEFTNDTTADTIDLLGDPVVQFTDASTGSPATWSWDLDGDGILGDATVPNPTHDYTGTIFPTCSVTVTLVVTRNSGSETDSVSHVLTIDDGGGPCP